MGYIIPLSPVYHRRPVAEDRSSPCQIVDLAQPVLQRRDDRVERRTELHGERAAEKLHGIAQLFPADAESM
jgi:hypothetical protein